LLHDWLTGLFTGDGGFWLTPVGEVGSCEASWDGGRGKLIGFTFGRGGNSEQNINNKSM